MDCCCCHQKTKHRSPEEQRSLINRLSRIEGQVRGLRDMLQKGCLLALDIFGAGVSGERGAEQLQQGAAGYPYPYLRGRRHPPGGRRGH